MVSRHKGLKLLGCLRDRSCWRKAEHLLNRSGRLQLLVDLSRACNGQVTHGGIMTVLHVLGQTNGGQEGHLTTSAFVQIGRSAVLRLGIGCG